MEKIKYVKKAEAFVRGEGSEYTIANYITKENSEKVSVAVSELSGDVPETMNTVSNRIYYFMEGDAEFVFADQTIKIEKASALFIPAGIRYKMRGTFKALLINAPAFSILDEKHFD